MVATLRAWLDAAGDVIAASASVYVHLNTFRYRLRRLAEVGGLDPSDPHSDADQHAVHRGVQLDEIAELVDQPELAQLGVPSGVRRQASSGSKVSGLGQLRTSQLRNSFRRSPVPTAASASTTGVAVRGSPYGTARI